MSEAAEGAGAIEACGGIGSGADGACGAWAGGTRGELTGVSGFAFTAVSAVSNSGVAPTLLATRAISSALCAPPCAAALNATIGVSAIGECNGEGNGESSEREILKTTGRQARRGAFGPGGGVGVPVERSDKFGATVRRKLVMGGKLMFSELQLGSSIFCVNDPFPESRAPEPGEANTVGILIYVEPELRKLFDVDAIWEQCRPSPLRLASNLSLYAFSGFAKCPQVPSP